jgi:lycopene cyclase domain-containing protein
MLTVEFLRHFAYLAMEAVIIGGVAFVLWAFHLRFLWARRWRILLGLVLVSVYTLPMDALAVSLGWGGFNPAYVSGIYFLDGVLLLEEIIFWSGTSFVTLSAVLIFAELERQGVPWWALALGVVIPLEWIISAFSPASKKATKSEV